MTNELTIEQKLEAQVKDLKSRILDTQDAYDNLKLSEQELAKTLTEIVSIIGLQSDSGHVTLDAILEAVAALVPVEAEAVE